MATIIKNTDQTYSIIKFGKPVESSLSKQEVIVYYRVFYGMRTSVYEELNKLEKEEYAKAQREKLERGS